MAMTVSVNLSSCKEDENEPEPKKEEVIIEPTEPKVEETEAETPSLQQLGIAPLASYIYEMNGITCTYNFEYNSKGVVTKIEMTSEVSEDATNTEIYTALQPIPYLLDSVAIQLDSLEVKSHWSIYKKGKLTQEYNTLAKDFELDSVGCISRFTNVKDNQMERFVYQYDEASHLTNCTIEQDENTTKSWSENEWNNGNITGCRTNGFRYNFVYTENLRNNGIFMTEALPYAKTGANVALAMAGYYGAPTQNLPDVVNSKNGVSIHYAELFYEFDEQGRVVKIKSMANDEDYSTETYIYLE